MSPDLAGLREIARVLIEPGFYDLDEVLYSSHEWADEMNVAAESVDSIVTEVWNDRLAAQRTWTTPSDYDRKQAAFDDLEQEGILGRMCFACCTNCATLEIDFERSLHPDPPDWYKYREWAYTYFHLQSAAVLVDPPPAELVLGYSAFRALPDLPEGADEHEFTDL